MPKLIAKREYLPCEVGSAHQVAGWVVEDTQVAAATKKMLQRRFQTLLFITGPEPGNVFHLS